MSEFENSFFREATLQICGSLDAKAALRRFLDFLRNFMPADGIFLHVVEPSLFIIRCIAHVSYDNQKRLDEIIPLSKEAIEVYQSREKELVIRPKGSPIFRKIAEELGMPDMSLLILHMNIDGERIGTLGIYTEGADQYSEEHARLLSEY